MQRDDEIVTEGKRYRLYKNWLKNELLKLKAQDDVESVYRSITQGITQGSNGNIGNCRKTGRKQKTFWLLYENISGNKGNNVLFKKYLIKRKVEKRT